jgi:hypothetical protein
MEKRIYELDEQKSYLEHLSDKDFTLWLKRSLKRDEFPIALIGRDEEISTWLATQSFRNSNPIQKNISQAIPSLLKDFSLSSDGPDYLCDLLWLAGVYQVTQSYEYLLEHLDTGSYRGVKTQDPRTSYWGDLHMYLCGTAISVAPSNDERLREICIREIEGKDPGFNAFYAALLNKFDDSSQYVSKYFPQFVDFSMKNERSYICNFLLSHFYQNLSNREYFIGNMECIIGKLSRDELTFFAQEVKNRKNRIEEHRTKAGHIGKPDDFNSFLSLVLGETERIQLNGLAQPDESCASRSSVAKPTVIGFKSPAV